MEAKELKYILEELRFSAELPTEVLDHLSVEASLQQLTADSVVFREGSVVNRLYLIRNGRIALEMNVPGRGSVRILTLGPGEMVGWSSLLDQGKMTASAVAVEASEVVVAPADKLREMCERNQEFGFHLMRRMAGTLSRRLVATRLQLLDVFAETPSTISASPAEGEG